MTHSTTNITCVNSDCKCKFDGVIYELFKPEVEYSVQCPHCGCLNLFYGVTGIVDDEIPQNAVKINYTARL